MDGGFMEYFFSSEAKGLIFLPKSCGINFSSFGTFSVKIDKNREKRFRTFFDKSQNKMYIYIHLNKENEQDRELYYELKSCLDHDVGYFLGSYPSKGNVVYMRARIIEVDIDKEDMDEKRELMKERLLGENIGDFFSVAPTEEEKKEALELLSDGEIFCLEVISYAFNNRSS